MAKGKNEEERKVLPRKQVSVQRKLASNELLGIADEQNKIYEQINQKKNEIKAFSSQKKAEIQTLEGRYAELSFRFASGTEWEDRLAYVLHDYDRKEKLFIDVITGKVIQTEPISPQMIDQWLDRQREPQITDELEKNEIQKNANNGSAFFVKRLSDEIIQGSDTLTQEMLINLEADRIAFIGLCIDFLYTTEAIPPSTNFDTAFEVASRWFNEFYDSLEVGPVPDFTFITDTQPLKQENTPGDQPEAQAEPTPEGGETPTGVAESEVPNVDGSSVPATDDTIPSGLDEVEKLVPTESANELNPFMPESINYAEIDRMRIANFAFHIGRSIADVEMALNDVHREEFEHIKSMGVTIEVAGNAHDKTSSVADITGFGNWDWVDGNDAVAVRNAILLLPFQPKDEPTLTSDPNSEVPGFNEEFTDSADQTFATDADQVTSEENRVNDSTATEAEPEPPKDEKKVRKPRAKKNNGSDSTPTE